MEIKTKNRRDPARAKRMAMRLSQRRHSGSGLGTVWVGVLLVTIIIFSDTAPLTKGLFVLGFTASYYPSELPESHRQSNIDSTCKTRARQRNHNNYDIAFLEATRSRHHRKRIASRLWSSTNTFTTSSAFSPWTSTPLDPTQILPETTLDAIEQLVQARGTARWEGNYNHADQLKAQLLQIELPVGIELCLEDVPRSEGGGSVWKLLYQTSTLLDEQESTTVSSSQTSTNSPSVLQLAHAALGWTVSCSQTMVPRPEKQKQLQTIVEQAKESLRAWKYIQEQQLQPFSTQLTDNTSSNETANGDEESTTISPTAAAAGWRAVETSLRGRKAADAAFWFALAGTTDAELFDLLALVCTKELHRFGAKPTCRAKDIAQMMDRFAAAGIRSGQHPALETIAKHCLELKQQQQQEQQQQDTADSLSYSVYSSLLELHSDRTLLMLWKFSARQKKQQSFLQSAQKHWEQQQRKDNKSSNGGTMVAAPSNIHDEQLEAFSWNDRFEDTTKPLIIDVGCGMGISLLGLASLPESQTHKRPENEKGGHPATAGVQLLNQDELNNCNMLGVDLSGLAIGYAQGIAERWGLGHRLQFEVDNAEALLEKVRDSYPGPVSLCLIQFPTPYRLPQEPSENSETSGAVSGNSQLPDSAYEGFMVSPNLLQLVQEVLSNKNKSNIGSNGAIAGKLLLQSNCEDVALWMQQTAVQGGYKNSIASTPLDIAQNDNLPQRTKNWIAMGGERAVGKLWSSESLLPQKGSTETEVACRLNNIPVHRCLLTLNG